MVDRLLGHFKNDLPMDPKPIRKILKKMGVKNLVEQNSIITAALKSLIR